jgi:hypothetical protein
MRKLPEKLPGKRLTKWKPRYPLYSLPETIEPIFYPAQSPMGSGGPGASGSQGIIWGRVMGTIPVGVLAVKRSIPLDGDVVEHGPQNAGIDV